MADKRGATGEQRWPEDPAQVAQDRGADHHVGSLSGGCAAAARRRHGRARVGRAAPGVTIFDVSWGDDRAYREAHVPGAIHFDTPPRVAGDRLRPRRSLRPRRRPLLSIAQGSACGTFLIRVRCLRSQSSSPNHLRADRLGMKKYSPPRRTLNVSIPWTRRLTGSLGMVKTASSS
jgi:hypothetical protein